MTALSTTDTFSGRQRLLVCAILLVLPALLLFESLFLGNEYVPFDHRVFAPHSTTLSAEQIADLQARGNWEITEKTMLVVPEFDLAKQELAEGRLPHYNPWVRSGAPLFANVLDGFAYPLHLPLFFGRTQARFALVAFLAFALAGLFMFGFLRSLRLSWIAALFGAITFQLSGTLSANGHFYMRMETLAWLPAGFCALECFARTQSTRSAACFALSLAMTWLAGFPPYAFVCSLAFGARILTIVGAHALTRRGLADAPDTPASFVRSVLLLGLATTLGIGLAAVQLVPMFEYFPQAQRNLSQGLDELASQGIDPLALFGVAMPYPFGDPIGTPEVPIYRHPLLYQFWSRTSPTSGKLYSDITYNFTEYAIYIGVVSTVCALAGMLRGARFRVFAAAAVITAFVLSMGGAVFQSLASLPIIKSTPPMRFVGLCAFFAAALAGIGFDTLTQRAGRVMRRGCEIVCALGAAAALTIALWSRGLADAPERAIASAIDAIGAGWRADYPSIAGDEAQLRAMFGEHAAKAYDSFAHSFLGLALGLLGVTFWLVSLPYPHATTRARLRTALLALAIGANAGILLHNARLVNPSFEAPSASEIENGDSVLRFLREARKKHADEGGFAIARVADGATLPTPLPPNLLIPEHIRDLNSYAFVDARSHRAFLALYGPGQMIRQYWLKALPVDARLARGLFDLFGVRYWISKKPYPALGTPAHTHDEGGHGQTYVYENEGVLPRAWLVAQAKLAEGPDARAADDAVIARLIAEDFDPRSELWIHDTAAATLEHDVAEASAIEAAKLRFRVDEATHVAIEVDASPGAWLVLSDAVYSNWNAKIDGQDHAWHRANLYNRAVWVPKGKHVVSFHYDTTSFYYGWIATIASLLAVVVMLILRRDSKRGAASEPVHESLPEFDDGSGAD